MIKRLLLAVVMVAALAGGVFAQTIPAGVPPPPFTGVTNPLYTHYIDNTILGATDTNNPNGSPLKPRVTIPQVLPAGSIVEVHGGPYGQGGTQKTFTSGGTATQPVVVRGVGNPKILGGYGAKWTLTGNYLDIEGLSFENVNITVTGDFTVLKGLEVSKHSPSGNSAAIAIAAGAGATVISGCQIHDNGDPNSLKEIDIHGILIQPGSAAVWILNNNIYRNGGDGIQVGQAQSTEPWMQYVWIAGNTIHEDRENAVDIKKSRDVVVVGNFLYGYKETSSSSGEAIVAHDNAERVWVLNNVVANSVRGVVSTGVATFVVAGNIITGIRHNPNNTYDPTSLYASHGIIARDSKNISVVGNTIVNSDGGIVFPSGNAGTVSAIDNAVAVNVQPLAGTFTEAHDNILSGDLKLVSSGDFHPQAASPLVDAGVYIPLWEAYKFLYGVPVDKDIYGGPRPAGAGWDVGAVEFQP